MHSLLSVPVNEQEDELEEAPETALARPMPSADYRDPLTAYLALRKSPESLRATIETLRLLARVQGIDQQHEDPECFRDIPWTKLGAEETTAILGMLQRAGYADATIRLAFAVLRGVLRSHFRFKHISADQFMRATDWGRLPKEPRRPKRELQPEEREKLFVYCDSLLEPLATFCRAILAVTLGGGLRRAEVAGLKADALGTDGKLRFIGKGRKPAVQPLKGWALDAVRAWVQKRVALGIQSETLFIPLLRADGGRLELSVRAKMTPWRAWDCVRRIQQGAGVEKFTPHDLRRTFGTREVAKGIGTARVLMRHKDGATTMSYDQSTEEQAAKALDETINELGRGPAKSATTTSVWIHQSKRKVRLRVTPQNTPVVVDLYQVLQDFGDYPAAPENVEPLLDALACGEVVLRVVSLKHTVPVDWRTRYRNVEQEASGQTQRHQILCALAWAFLIERGKTPTLGPQHLDYSAGRADVAATDRSVFVECGTVRGDKVKIAMNAGDTVLVVPYRYGCTWSENQARPFVFQPEVDEASASWGKGMQGNEFGDAMKFPRSLFESGSIQFGYLFKPKPGALAKHFQEEQDKRMKVMSSFFNQPPPSTPHSPERSEGSPPAARPPTRR